MKIYNHNYKCIHFKLEEILPPKLYESLKTTNKLSDGYKYFPEKSLMMIDNLRMFFNRKVTINTWITKGQFSFRGLRTPDSSDYSATSQHSIGFAFDFDVEGLTAEQVRQEIIKNKNNKLLLNIGGLELGTGWVHIDARNRVNGKIVAFDTKNKVSYL